MEVITEKHRKERLIHKIHAGAIDGDTISATNSSGHFVINKTVRAVCSRFYWPDISGEVRTFINPCRKCQMKKDHCHPENFYTHASSAYSNQMMSQVGIDLMKMKETPDGYNYVISAIDYFTKFAELGALKDKATITVGRWIYENIFCR